MGYKKRRRIVKDPITGKSLAWQKRELESYGVLDENGFFDPEAWCPTNEKSSVEAFIFHPTSLANLFGVSVGYLEAAVADPRCHVHPIGPPEGGIRATAQNSGQWWGEVRRQEARAKQAEAGRRTGAENLIRWVVNS